MKEVTRARFVPAHYNCDLFKKIELLKHDTKSAEDYFQEMEIAIIRANIDETEEETCMLLEWTQPSHQENHRLPTVLQSPRACPPSNQSRVTSAG